MTMMKGSLDVSARRESRVISGLIDHVGPRHRFGALVLMVLVLLSSGCGTSTDLSNGVQGTAKERKDEERYRYEGTGKAKTKTLIRRKDVRLQELQDAAKKQG
jgi:hypothetical protein